MMPPPDPLAELDRLRLMMSQNPDALGRDLARLVLALIDFLRELLERQAVRQLDEGGITDAEADRLGDAFYALDATLDRLCAEFGLQRADLNLSLGPLGRLLE